MNRRTIAFLLLCAILYPLGLCFIQVNITSLEIYVILTCFYIYIVGWCSVELEKELEEKETVKE